MQILQRLVAQSGPAETAVETDDEGKTQKDPQREMQRLFGGDNERFPPEFSAAVEQNGALVAFVQ